MGASWRRPASSRFHRSAAAKLFGPLGIASTSLQWADYNNHTQTDTGGHIYLRPRDMSKIGQLVLQGGQWNGQQVISNAWITRSTSRHGAFSQVGARGGYGYLWWLSKENYKTGRVDVIRADGNGGQYIFIVPALDLVAVFTGENYDSDKANLPFQLLTTYVLPPCSSKPQAAVPPGPALSGLAASGAPRRVQRRLQLMGSASSAGLGLALRWAFSFSFLLGEFALSLLEE